MRGAPAPCECSCNRMRHDRCARMIVSRITDSRVLPATASAATVSDAECEAPRGSHVAALLESCDGALFARALEL